VAARRHDQRGLVVFFAVSYLAGFAGLLVAPHAGAWLWAALLGVAGGSFPLALTLIGLRATTPRTTVALSAMAQSGGYALAAIGPLAVGVLHDLVGDWTVSLLFVIALLAIQIPAGLVAGRPTQPSAQRA
jgi:CP family cyanate transporter-like MFS transporter